MQSAGLFDLQVNGYAGVDFNDAGLTAAAMDHALEAMLSAGVTRCLPTLITADEATLGARFAALDRAVAESRLGPLMVPGWHLEGPFLNPGEGTAGCHPAEAMRAPDPSLLERVTRDLRRPILLLTLAPERADAAHVLAWARRRGVLLAMGHTAADLDTVTGAVDAGVRLSTHLGNGLPHLLPKFLNPLMAQLAEDRLHASVIADGIHVPIHALRVMLRAKGPERIVLVTDATAAAAAPSGLYGFAGMRIEHAADGSVRVPGGRTLAGSALRLDQAVRNVVGWGLASAAQALAWASTSPADLLAPAQAAQGVVTEAGSVTWSDDLHARTIVLGNLRLQPT
ncbi:MAG: N-acetylglucosamine-6-phosphate deacetylase [Rhodospirillales bacterium]|nr:N-acetylglucosamine-6-phosphate deacetylase [Rhodospirillales bacterium]MBN8905579.1 N-acetylglucosamine-6-phosphate deacetylase [Rhodospirillales bacterium]